MADDNPAREELLDLVFERIEADRYPSATMLDIVEKLMTPDDHERYLELLMDKIGSEAYPSMSLVRRVMAYT